jgi:membrane protease YdiL (CAAX protease family)
VIGPSRRGQQINNRPLVIVLIASLAIWFAVQQGFVTFLRIQQSNAGQTKFDIEQMSPADWAFLSIVPGAAGIVLIIVGHLGGKSGSARELGFAPDQIGRGFLIGLVGFIVVLPVVNWTLIFLEWLYNRLHIQHPNEHDLLRVLGQTSSPGARIAIIVGATIVAPVFEEFVFRGHLQTLLVRLFTRARNAPRGFVLAGDQIEPIDPPLRTVDDERPLLYWLAILITSFIFAAIHPPWMAPAIFVLAICIGYVYQRSGNLWSAITMHALFNIVNTLEFLYTSKELFH